MNETFTSEEILDKLKGLESRLLKRVFDASYSENLRTYDLIDHLEGKACEYSLVEDGDYVSLIRDLRKLGSSIGALINGKRGESMAAKTLKCLSGEDLVLSNVALENGGSFEEYDQIVIARSGVYVIEVKNYSRAALIGEDGILRCGAVTYNVGERMLEKRRALWDAIRFSSEGFMSEDDIHCMLLFVNDDFKVSDYFHRVPVKRRGQIVYDIRDADRGGLGLEWEEMKRISSAIVTRKVPATFPMPVDPDLMVTRLEAVLTLIEAMATDNLVATEVSPVDELKDCPANKSISSISDRVVEWLPVAAALLLGAIGIGGYAKCTLKA